MIAVDPCFDRWLAVAMLVAFGACDAQHGLDLGGGINYWLTERAGLRLDVRATRLTQNFRSPGWPDVSEWLVAVRGGVNFARRRF